MNTFIKYKTKKNTFSTRSEFLDYCESHVGDKKDAEFNSASFVYKNLPNYVTMDDYVEPVIAAQTWLKKLKNEEKPLVLLFSGGVDSIFALNCMLDCGFPPKYILVYTLNPFDRSDIMCSHDMEPMYALQYLKERINNDLRLNKTKIWHVHLNQDYAEDFFSNKNWLKISGYSYSIETMGLWFELPKINEETIKKYTFIKGGDFPRATVIEEKLNFFIVDLQLGERTDRQPIKCYDFVLDNKLMFNSLCVKYAEKINQEKNSIKNCYANYKNDGGSKYLLDEFSNLMSDCVPQLDKRFSEKLEPYNSDPKDIDELILRLHRNPLKTWLCYLQSEFFQPNWFQCYKKTVSEHYEWIEKRNRYLGKLSQFIEFK